MTPNAIGVSFSAVGQVGEQVHLVHYQSPLTRFAVNVGHKYH